ncbi:MAG: FKBP-type peptidyl-prolyl cis-trans isomerase [Chitinophagaceae bacterium]|nr:FKBP-type peptidyl-prolyl cis-trans isomerase [Chitinophagaceae bacterium]
MKRINYLLVTIAVLSLAVACNKVTYKKTKSGLAYKLFPSKGKDSLLKDGQIVKFNYTIKFNDSLMDRFNSYGKMPGYVKIQKLEKPTYDFQELLPLLKKGDSVVTVQMADSLMKYQAPILPPNAKKGDRLIMTVKILEVFSVDSVALADYNKEVERDRPRQEKEQQAEMARAQKEQEEMRKKEEEELEKSGEVAKELKEMDAYLAAKKINAQKTGKGTYVTIKEQGTGAQAANDKYVNVKYSGRILRTDSVFQSNAYAFQLGRGNVIRGWDEGLLLFKEGGKGTLYIPGFLAYGKNPGPGSQPFEALIFDIELLQVSDSAITEQRQPRH